jgi:Fe-S-cluster containining protein
MHAAQYRAMNNDHDPTRLDVDNFEAATGEHSARAFFANLQTALTDTLRNTSGTPVLIDALLHQAFDTFEGNLRIQCEAEPDVVCTRGCAFCCSLRVCATAPEVLLVARYVRALHSRLLERGVDLVDLVRSTDRKTRGLGEAERVALNKHCAFAARGVCIIYPVRPLACRGHASFDRKACAQAAAGQRDTVPFSPGHQLTCSLVQNALRSSLRDAGLVWDVYELSHALLLSLDDPNAEAQWLSGQESLAPAAVHEIAAEELSALFEQLRP